MLCTVAGSDKIIGPGGGRIEAFGSQSVDLMVSNTHSMASVLTMIAPSPDWFAKGTAELCDYSTGKWKEMVEVDAVAYDSGTDSGPTFEAANKDTDPQEVISRIESITGFGKFKFIRRKMCTGTGGEFSGSSPCTPLPPPLLLFPAIHAHLFDNCGICNVGPRMSENTGRFCVCSHVPGRLGSS